MKIARRILFFALLAAVAACVEDPEIARTARGLTGFLSADVAVSTTTPAAQDQPAAAVDVSGLTLVVFRDASSGDGGDIRGRFVSSAGVPLGSDFVINTVTGAAQSRPDVAVNDSAEFLVVWQDASLTAPDTSGSAVRARRLIHGGSGSPSFLDAADFVVPSRPNTAQTYPAVDAAPDGSFVVVWQDAVHTVDPSGIGVRARRISAAGVPLGVDQQINSTTAGDQSRPDVATGSDGSYVVAFTDGSGSGDASGTGIRARAFGSDDLPLGADALVNVTTTGAQSDPAVAPGASGFLVAWTDASGVGDPAPNGIRARRLAALGAPSGAELLVNSTTAGSQTLPAVAADGNDDSFIIAWADPSKTAPDTSGSAVRARRLLSDDSFAELDQVIDTTTTGAQSQPALPMRAMTSLLFAWTSPDGLVLGVRGRAMLLGCPQPTQNNFFADPLADRSMPGLPAPTGARSPGVCAFPRLTDALGPAGAAAATPGVYPRVVASRDSSSPGQLIDFAAESFPMLVPAGVQITTTDDYAVGGSGWTQDFSITVNSHTSGPASVRLLGAATRTEPGGAFQGLTLRESCTTCPKVALKVEGFGAEWRPRVSVARVVGTGADTWTTGVEVRGNGRFSGFNVESFASGTEERIGVHILNDGGAQASDRVYIEGGNIVYNNVGIDISGGQVLIDTFNSLITYSSRQLDNGTSGDGIRIRDWRLDAQGNPVVVPATVRLTDTASEGNDGNGIVVDFRDPASTALLDGVTSDVNGRSGLRVTGAPHADAALDQIAAPVTQYGLVVLSSTFSNNLGHGMYLGYAIQPYQIVAKIGDFGQRNFFERNGQTGIFVQQSAAAGSCPTAGPTACTGVTIVNDQIAHNGGEGLHLATGILVPLYEPARPGLRYGFLYNTIFHNAFAAQPCDSPATFPQIFVNARVGLPEGICDDQLSQGACDAASAAADNNHCVWTGNACHVAWDLRGDDAACDIARVNHMFEYNTTDVGGGTVGLYANNTSFVQADGNAWASSATPNQHVAYAAGSFVDASQVCWFISGCSL